jgi:hypothetical protein
VRAFTNSFHGIAHAPGDLTASGRPLRGPSASAARQAGNLGESLAHGDLHDRPARESCHSNQHTSWHGRCPPYDLKAALLVRRNVHEVEEVIVALILGPRKSLHRIGPDINRRPVGQRYQPVTGGSGSELHSAEGSGLLRFTLMPPVIGPELFWRNNRGRLSA